MTTVEELKASVRDANRIAEEGNATLRSAASDAAQASGLAAQVLHDSQHPEVTDALAALADVERETELTARRFAAAVGHANAYLARLG
ncbi:hypothetical protein ACFP2T_03615 [Plantactinospora solaniradicis]|uniref:Uncharacterized protein n=1 Tax=Plantactinospora solaniradicis TaxID=1723736 RepID=A0ABW1K2T2_9ACTN